MSYTTTSLGLQLPVPGSGQSWSTAVYNSNLTKIDNAVKALQDSAGSPTSGTIAAASGYVRQGDTFLRKMPDGMIEMYVDFTGSFPNVASRTVGTVPAGFRPSTSKPFPLAFNGNDIPDAGTATLNPDGAIVVVTPAGSHNQCAGFVKYNPSA